MTLDETLKGIACTKPFTCADARDLHTIVKRQFPNALVCVYTTRGDTVYVRVDGVIRDLPVV